MVNRLAGQLDETFGALADPTRRAMLAMLAAGERSVSDLAAPFDMSLPAITKHLRVLDRAGLIQHYKAGRVRWCRAVPGPLEAAEGWLQFYRRFWDRQLDGLEAFIERKQQEDPTWYPRPHPPAGPTSSGSSARSRRRGKKSSTRGRTRR